MAGRRNWLLMVGLLASGILLTWADSAQAQGYAQSNAGVTIRKDALEKVKWYNAPREFQIIDPSPTVRDFRSGPEENGTVTIPIGPVGSLRNGKDASNPAGGLRVGTPQVRFLGSDLPNARLGSNINESRLKPGGLPSGKSTNLLAGTPVKQKPALVAHSERTLAGTRPVVAVKPDTKLLTYPSISSGTGSGQTGLSTSLTVSAKLKHGSLLHK